MLRQFSYAMKTQPRHPRPRTRSISCLSLCLYGIWLAAMHRKTPGGLHPAPGSSPLYPPACLPWLWLALSSLPGRPAEWRQVWDCSTYTDTTGRLRSTTAHKLSCHSDTAHSASNSRAVSLWHEDVWCQSLTCSGLVLQQTGSCPPGGGSCD